VTGLREIRKPASEPLSLEETAAFIRLADESDNRVVERLIAAARYHVEQSTRRCFVTRTLEATFDEWPIACRRYNHSRQVQEPELLLPGSPLVDVVKVQHLDLDGELQTVDPAIYRTIVNQEPGRIRRRKNASWPNTSDEGDSIIVTYRAGYGEDDDVPSDAKVAMLMLVGHWYENREAVDISTGGTVTSVPDGFRAIVNNLTVPRVS